MINKIISYRGVLIFYALIIISILSLNARLEALNRMELSKEIAINQSIVD